MRDIQHIPWCGSNYGKGIEGRRVCIVGYSHYKDNGELDTDGFTVGVLEDVIRGARRIAFFTQIKNYFAFKEHGEFWNRVLFFNYVHGRPARRRDILPKCSDFVIRGCELRPHAWDGWPDSGEAAVKGFGSASKLYRIVLILTFLASA
jgi:hypothetical protein